MGNRASQSLSESSQALANSLPERRHAYPNLGFEETRGRSGSLSSFDSSPSHSEAEAPAVPPRSRRRWSMAAAIAEEAPALAGSARPRIQPIVRSGRQVTKDFYWVLPQRRPPRLYHNLPGRRSCRSESDAPTPPDGAAAAQPLVADVQRRVLGVTDDECFVALSLHGWDAERAARYLMVEQLFRLGLADRGRCLAELRACGWDLQSAAAAVLQNCPTEL